MKIFNLVDYEADNTIINATSVYSLKTNNNVDLLPLKIIWLSL